MSTKTKQVIFADESNVSDNCELVDSSRKRKKSTVREQTESPHKTPNAFVKTVHRTKKASITTRRNSVMTGGNPYGVDTNHSQKPQRNKLSLLLQRSQSQSDLAKRLMSSQLVFTSSRGSSLTTSSNQLRTVLQPPSLTRAKFLLNQPLTDSVYKRSSDQQQRSCSVGRKTSTGLKTTALTQPQQVMSKINNYKQSDAQRSCSNRPEFSLIGKARKTTATTFRLANTSVALMQEKERKFAEKRMAKQRSELALCTFKPNLGARTTNANGQLLKNSIMKTTNNTTSGTHSKTSSQTGHQFERLYQNASRQKHKLEL